MLVASEPIRVLDLFAGAGGLTRGLHEASNRFTTTRAVEWDLAAAATYRANFGDVVYPGDIEHWLRDEHVPEADLIVGGPPCQGFSALGKQDPDDKRNEMWRHYVETVALANPKYFVLENVPQFLKSPDFASFCAEMRPRGRLRDYEIVTALPINAADYGAPQSRKRVVVVARHRDCDNPGPLNTAAGSIRRTVRDAFKGINSTVTVQDLPLATTSYWDRTFRGEFKSPQLHITRNYTELSRKRFSQIPAGGNRFDIDDAYLAPCWLRHREGSADVMGRLHLDRPSVTIRTEFFKPEKGRYIHPTEDRAITHYEASLLQGFPDDHNWVGSKTAIAKQIGNAVPVPLARAIGAHLLDYF